MFHKNLKYYRLKNNLTKAALASKAGVSPMAITHYENGDRRPDMSTIKELANILGVRTIDFLHTRNTNLVFLHEQFRKGARLNQRQQEYVRESVEEYFSRFYEILEILGGEVLPDTLPVNNLPLSEDAEENALTLRKYLSISESGPIGNLTELLENKGILLFQLDMDNSAFSGMNGTVNGRPYIVINKNMTPERIRTTIVHELAHFAFQWSDHNDPKAEEKMATAIAGAFLFPEADARRELGLRRRAITTDMFLICKEYGIALSLLVVRAHLCGIINDTVYKNYFIKNKKSEPSQIASEEPALFEQLVYRAVNEEEITIQKGAELLKMSYDSVKRHCCEAEV